jgi:hypothetical protein
MNERVIVCSSDWYFVETKAVNNENDIVIGPRIFDDEAECYVSCIALQLTGDAKRKLYAELRHYFSHCFPEECPYCEKKEEEKTGGEKHEIHRN